MSYIYTCIYTKVFEVIQEDMRHLRLSFDIVWQWENIGLYGRLTRKTPEYQRFQPEVQVLLTQKKVFIQVKFEKVIVISVSLMDLNTNLHLTLKLEMLKVKVKDKVSRGIVLIIVYRYMHVKFEIITVNSFPTNGPKCKFAFDLETENV